MFVFITILQPDSEPESSSFRKPQTEMNIASGCPQFALQSDVESNNFSSMTHMIHSGRRLKLGVTPYLSDKAGDWEFGPIRWILTSRMHCALAVGYALH